MFLLALSVNLFDDNLDFLDITLTEDDLKAGEDLIDSMESPTKSLPIGPHPTTTKLARIPIKILLKIDPDNKMDTTLLDRNTPFVSTFFLTADPQEKFWQQLTFFSALKIKSLQTIHKSFPFTILKQSKINYDLVHVKSLYRSSIHTPIAVRNFEPQATILNLATPLFITNTEAPADMVVVFKLIVHPTYTNPTQDLFVRQIRSLALCETKSDLEIIGHLLSYFNNFKTHLTLSQIRFDPAVTNEFKITRNTKERKSPYKRDQ